MAIDPLNYALDLQVESLYDPGERFCQEFYEFAYRLNSLSRHWYVTRRFIVGYLADLRAAKRKDSAAEEEMLLSDQEYFPEFLRGAVLAHGLTLLETLLSDVAREVASELGTDQELNQRPLPYVNRYILFLTRVCGLELDVSKDLWRRLDAIRELRNRYIHKLDRDLPLQIKATLAGMADEAESTEHAIDDRFVESGLSVIAELARQLECAYWRWFDKRRGT